jgi:hypothetical protein
MSHDWGLGLFGRWIAIVAPHDSDERAEYFVMSSYFLGVVLDDLTYDHGLKGGSEQTEALRRTGLGGRCSTEKMILPLFFKCRKHVLALIITVEGPEAGGEKFLCFLCNSLRTLDDIR